MSSTTPSATRNSASLLRLHVENGRPWSAGRDSAIFLICCRWASVKVGGRPPAYFGYNESKPSSLKLLITSRTRSRLVKVTLAIPDTSTPCTDNSTICARRQVTTDPDERRTTRNNRLPSSFDTSPTRKPSRATTPPTRRLHVRSGCVTTGRER